MWYYFLLLRYINCTNMFFFVGQEAMKTTAGFAVSFGNSNSTCFCYPSEMVSPLHQAASDLPALRLLSVDPAFVYIIVQDLKLQTSNQWNVFRVLLNSFIQFLWILFEGYFFFLLFRLENSQSWEKQCLGSLFLYSHSCSSIYGMLQEKSWLTLYF